MRDWVTVTAVSLLKYQAYGNDFLVAVDPTGLPGTDELDGDFVVAVCDRHRGIGADGVMVVRPAPPSSGGRTPDAAMELRNADGGRAETSGNGLACLALALVDAGRVPGPEVLVSTDAGPRLVTVLDRIDGAAATMRTEMGALKVGEARQAAGLDGFEARRVDAGNPHLVMMGPSLEGVDIASLGRSLEQAEPGGQNVEVVAPDGRGGLDLLVWERGVGLTEACGTGSCAAAAAARAAGFVSSRVEVHNPGGTLLVELQGDDTLTPSVYLSGRASRVFRVELAPSEIDALG
jgi:diaminopimelate epimerase